MFRKTDDVRCENCVFWERYEPGAELGWCQRYPPIHPDRAEPNESHFHPISSGDSWCGEFQHRSRQIPLPRSLSVRTRNILRKQGIESMGELAEYTEQEMLDVHKCGYTSLNEMVAALHNFGMAFKKP